MTIAYYIRDKELSRNVQKTLVDAGLDCEDFLSETSLLRTLRYRSFDLILLDTSTEADIEEHVFSWVHCRTGEITPVVVMSSSRHTDLLAYALGVMANDLDVEKNLTS